MWSNTVEDPLLPLASFAEVSEIFTRLEMYTIMVVIHAVLLLEGVQGTQLSENIAGISASFCVLSQNLALGLSPNSVC